jgi:FG-GAP repeat/FG-GAP-like repeat
VYQYIGDLNDDGIPDLAVAAPRSTGASEKKEDGKVYIFYGKGTWMDPLIDLEGIEPDITIWGNVTHSDLPGGNRMGLCLVSAIRAGDFDGDGDDDLALCAPTNNMSGLCYIIYKDTDHWPALIKVKMDDMFLYRQIFSNSQYAVLHHDTFVTSDEGPMFSTMIYGCGGYSTPTDDQVCDFFQVKDIDQDGIDDIVWGGMAGWTYHAVYQSNRGNLRILWGEHPDRYDDNFARMVPTYDLTCLDDKTGFYRYGISMDIGDIDGDGWTDAVVGSPWTTSEVTGLKQSGAVYVYYNISRLNKSIVEDVAGNEGVLNHSGPASTSIYGSGEGDEFGKAVLLRDIDGDGNDDIIASAPYSDGPGRNNIDCGEIYVFKGRSEMGFPDLMSAESDFDMMLVGPSGRSDRIGRGFRLGEMFELGDITGDGRLDMVIAVKDLDLPMMDDTMRYHSGAVLFYDHSNAFPPNSRIVQIDHPSGFFTLEGRDIGTCSDIIWNLGTSTVTGSTISLLEPRTPMEI